MDKVLMIGELKKIGLSESAIREITQIASKHEITEAIDIYHQGLEKKKISSPGWIKHFFSEGNRCLPKWYQGDPQSLKERLKYIKGYLSEDWSHYQAMDSELDDYPGARE